MFGRLSLGVRLLPIAMAAAVCLPTSAYAYRPFNLTDAAVAERTEMELECGPVGYLVDAEGRFLVAPSLIFNFGLADRWEVVVEGRNFFQVEGGEDRHYTMRDTALSVKHVFREGSLQERTGPSIGFEVGMLLPGIGADSGVGAAFAGLLSQRWSSFTLHVNGSLELTHGHRLAGLGGAIVEGPFRWAVRPVVEFVVEQDEARTVSGLVGAIWKVRDNLSLDAGWRVARTEGNTERELRAGFTWTVPLGSRAMTAPPTRPRIPVRGALL